MNEANNIKGIQKVTPLPDLSLKDNWDSIIVDEDIKTRLISQAVINFTVRSKISQTIIPLHGIILLVGPPGTGKTTLARGLANETASVFEPDSNKFTLIEIEPHELTSSAMGRTQKAVSELFSQTIPELASSEKVIVLIDEVETLVVNRYKLSFDTNPVDIHRATDAVLVQVDNLAISNGNLLFIATSNFPDAVDQAFVSRCDLVEEIPLPTEFACKQILTECLEGLGKQFPEIAKLVNEREFENCASQFNGIDGRTIRKTVANALASKKEVAYDPNKLTLGDLAKAAQTTLKHRS